MAPNRGIPHYYPACVLGGFGEPHPTKSGRRYRQLSVRKTADPGVIISKRAEKIATRWDEFTVDVPPPGMSPTFIDALWDCYETDLGPAIDAIGTGSFGQAEWECVVNHIHAQAVRNPDFLVKATAYLASLGIHNPTRDQLQLERLRVLIQTPQILADSRFALLYRPTDGRRLITNDKGYASLTDPHFGVPTVIFPLSPEVAVLMAVGAAQPGDDYLARPMRRFTLTPRAVELVNHASWSLEGITCIAGHQRDETHMLSLDANKPLVAMVLGPYRGTCDAGFCDWAVEKVHTARLTVPHNGQSWHEAHTSASAA